MMGIKKPLQKIEEAGCYVGMARFELATSWSQTRRDNRATLHPERIKTLYEVIGITHTNHFKKICCGESGIRTHGTV